jgi:NAD(P)-dependent dehydrogenase (short-subunit alcohol dehydrogenase family)
MMRLANKIAIVTGAAGGIGQASALLFAREGAKVAVNDLREEQAQATVDMIRAEGGTAVAIGGDISRSEDVKRIAARTVDELGLPNVLLNNAAVNLEQRLGILDIEEEAFARTVEVNLNGTWLMIKYVAPHMIAAGGGSIVNVSSNGAVIAASTAGYCASKAAVLGLTRVAARDLARHNIRVNALCPGATETPLAKQALEEMARRGMTPDLEHMSLFNRMATPDEMARMALFLASDDSSYATGASFMNDAGWSILSGVQSKD